ncbi:MAG: HAMP domain-containing histidine kinase [Lachnospiraceae bacterium]|nr:HAMP domain-containing histidine kinase [Lachnospiraceae bacterium]
MEILLIILTIAVGVESAWLLILWRQHLAVCRQLQFIREKDSCMRVSVNAECLGEVQLAGEINKTLDDVRDRKREMSEREKLIADAYANLSHDIRTPLTSLDGYVQLLRDAKTEEERERYTAVIGERIGTLKELLEDLFTFTKLKNEAFELELSPLSLRSVVADTVLSYYDTWKTSGVEPEIMLTDEVLSIEGNELAVKRILQNITKNAVLHGKNKLTVFLHRIDDDAEIVISNPVEHPEEIEVSRVFEQFYTADRFHRQASSGLGLAIAKEFTERMGGKIGASLEEGIFAVTIRLPLTKEYLAASNVSSIYGR